MGQDKRLGQRMIQRQPKLERYWQRAYREYGQRHLEHCYQRICDQRLISIRLHLNQMMTKESLYAA